MRPVEQMKQPEMKYPSQTLSSGSESNKRVRMVLDERTISMIATTTNRRLSSTRRLSKYSAKEFTSKGAVISRRQARLTMFCNASVHCLHTKSEARSSRMRRIWRTINRDIAQCCGAVILDIRIRRVQQTDQNRNSAGVDELLTILIYMIIEFRHI